MNIKDIDKGIEDAAKSLARLGRLVFSCKNIRRGTRSNELYNDDREEITRKRVRRSEHNDRRCVPSFVRENNKVLDRRKGERRSRFSQLPSTLL